jgi:predicted transcriptional regulator
MTAEKIGQAAGLIWNMLSQTSGQVNITDVAKKTNLTTQIAYQGLGWLAREGKLTYHIKGRSVYVSLIPAS